MLMSVQMNKLGCLLAGGGESYPLYQGIGLKFTFEDIYGGARPSGRLEPPCSPPCPFVCLSDNRFVGTPGPSCRKPWLW